MIGAAYTPGGSPVIELPSLRGRSPQAVRAIREGIRLLPRLPVNKKEGPANGAFDCTYVL